MSLSQLEAQTPEVDQDSRSGARRRRARRRNRITVGVLTGMVAIMAVTTTTLYLTARNLPSNIHRISGAFEGIKEEERPIKSAVAKNSMTFLLVGSDSRSQTTGSDAGDPQLQAGGQRSDVMMIVHLPTDRKSATVISVPRDSWVTIPGRGQGKLNWAYSWGGPPLLIRTIEQLTGDRIDHFAVVDFYGFKAIVEAVDGVDVPMAAGANLDGTNFEVGLNHLNGTQALAYVRERHSLPNGDLDRVKRQQNLIRAIMVRSSAMNPMSDPIKTYNLVDSGLKSISVDETLTNDKLRELALSLVGLRPANMSFLTAPVKGLGREGSQSVVYLDDTRGAALWTAIREDAVADYLITHKGDLLSTVPQ